MLEMKLFIDAEVVAFTLATFSVSLILFWRSGYLVAALHAVEIMFAAILPLGLEIYLYDRGQFNIHASDLQVKVGLAWFTNADILYLSSGVLAITFMIEILRLQRKGVPQTSTPQTNEAAPMLSRG